MKTIKEARKDYMDTIKSRARWWLRQKDLSEKEKIEGVIFSFYSIIDGVVDNLPPLNLIIESNIDDKENKYQNGMCINGSVYLHGIKGCSEL